MRYRNVILLALCQALGMAGPTTVVLLGGIIGAQLAPDPKFSTLPISLGVVSMAVMSIPGALLMRRIGRRKGFMLAVFVAACGALLAALAITQASFLLFCVATFLIGQNVAFMLQYRFAAAESVDEQFSARAVSMVLLGGILAGYLGPEIAKRSQSLLPILYTGSFIALAFVYLLVMIILLFMKDILAPTLHGEAAGRPLRQIVQQPNYLIAVMAGVASYGLMNFIMTATPVHMHNTGFNLDNTAFVIQSHIIAMYLPSLVTGFLLEKLGTARIMQAGALLMLGCTAVGIYSSELLGYWTALVLLGLGWNLLFVGGTVLLTTTYLLKESFKTQASNDFTIFAVQAISSFSAGSLLVTAGWQNINWLGLAIMALTLVIILAQQRQITLAKSQPVSSQA
ncbi:MAG: MFS transporter [Anaerolineales bacterium]